jgi:hypothetical protein
MDFDKLPNFLVIGAAKAGTTTLYDTLRQHPQVYMPAAKEVQFFSQETLFGKGARWYEGTFFGGADGYPARGEATPHYLYWSEKVAPRIAELYGGRPVRLVVCLRDPVQRAYSMYWMLRRRGREELSFARAVEEEPARLEEHRGWLEEQGSMAYGYLEGGRYATKLGPFLERFPRGDFLFVLQEDLRGDPKGVAAKVLDFVGADASAEVARVSSNPAAVPRSMAFHKLLRQRSAPKEVLKRVLPANVRWRIKTGLMRLNLKEAPYEPMEAGLEQELRLRFRDEVEELQRITGRDLSRWLPEG